MENSREIIRSVLAVPETYAICLKLIRHAFEDLRVETIWCGYFDGNDKSRRVQEKCGFVYHHTNKDIHWELMDDIRTEHITQLTKEQWKEGTSEADRLIDVRQCLNAIKEVTVFRPELCGRISDELSGIDLSQYKDSMSPLIQKDIAEVREIIADISDN